MGSFNPIKTAISAATNVAGLNADYNRSIGNYDIARRQYDLQLRKINADEQAQQEKLALESAEESRTRTDALRRSTARQRALFGENGIDTRDGSAEAVFAGLLAENDAAANYRTRLDKLRRDAIARDADYNRRRSLLDLDNTRRTGLSGAFSSGTSTLNTLLK